MDLAVTKLNEILTELKKTTKDEFNKFDRLAERVKTIGMKKFGGDLKYFQSADDVQNKVRSSDFGLSEFYISKLMGIVHSMIDDIELSQIKEQEILSNKTYDINVGLNSEEKSLIEKENLKVFIVHGHNDAMKEATARTLEKLGLTAIILHEKANAGDTIIEKLIKHSDVGFAVVLLSADDYGYAKYEVAANAKLRARQNVIFELGFFYCKLGRKRVVAIFEQNQNFEKPSDIDGVIYIPYGSDGKWKFDLVKELLETGYQVDANVLL